MRLWGSGRLAPEERTVPVYEVLEEEFARLHPDAPVQPASARSWEWTFQPSRPDDKVDEEFVDLRRLAAKLYRRDGAVARLLMEHDAKSKPATQRRMRACSDAAASVQHEQLEAARDGGPPATPAIATDGAGKAVEAQLDEQLAERHATAAALEARLGAYLQKSPSVDETAALREMIVEHLNAVLRSDALWSDKEVQALELSAFVHGLCASGPDRGRSTVELNRLILEAAFPGELTQTRDRRLAKLSAAVRELPTPSMRAALCLSGGGIRSATFALGVLQGLAKHGVLDRFTYLSTVSGGGYVGSWLSAWMYQSPPKVVISSLAGSADGGVDAATRSGFEGRRLEPEPSPIRHLREYSNYLSPRAGLLSADTWTLIATYVRNLLLNWLVLVPFLAGIVMLPRLIASVLRDTQSADPLSTPAAVAAVVTASVLAALAIMTVHRFSPSADESRGRGLSQPVFLLQCLLPLVAATALFIVWWEWFDNLAKPGDGVVQPAGPMFAFGLGAAIHTVGWAVALRREEISTWLPTLGGRNVRAAVSAIVRPLLRFGRDLLAVAVSGGLAGGLLYWVLKGIGVLARRFERDWEAGTRHGVHAHEYFATLAVPALLAIILVAGFVYVGLVSRRSPDASREWSARYSAWLLIATLGWLIAFAIVLLGPAFFAHGIVLALGSGIGGVAGIATLLLGGSGATPATADRDGTPGAAVRTRSAFRRWGLQLAAPAFAVAVVVLLSAFGAIALRAPCWMSASLAGCAAGAAADTTLAAAATAPSWLVIAIGIALVALGWAFGRFFIHANKFSLHAMYRARLIRAYLGAARPAGERRPHLFTGFDEHDNLRVCQLWPASATAAGVREPKGTPNPRPPFHVLNLTLNLVSGDNLAWQERKAAPFTVTPLHAGSIFVGYRRTSPRDNPDGSRGGRLYASDRTPLSLGTAMTISGAAASPNMGYHSSPLVTFLMTLFNARLGWWLGNPGPAGDETFHAAHPKDSIKPLLAEMFGYTSDRHEYVHLSDGGHFDNIGLYEMVLRRCRFIVVSDAGCDERFSFADLGNAVRKIRIDLGVPIDFRLGFPMYARDAEKEQKVAGLGRYCAIGTIRYSCVDRLSGHAAGQSADAPEYDPNYDGILLYIKPCFYARGEPRDVFNYAQSNPSFPHESTTDQFFSESQFESYRALGYHIVDTICTPPDEATKRQALMLGSKNHLHALSYLAQLHVGTAPGDTLQLYDPPVAAGRALWPPSYRFFSEKDFGMAAGDAGQRTERR